MSDAATESHGHADHAHEHHGPSLLLLFGIFVTLMLLTFLTVGVTVYDFGYQLNLVVAMAIALVKATLVGLFFMHLRWDPPIFSYVIVASLLFVTLFIVFSLIDTAETLNLLEQKALQQAASG